MATCIERTFVYYNFPSCNLVPLEAEQNDFQHRETNICVQGNIDDLHIFTDHFSPLVHLSLCLTSSYYPQTSLLCQVFCVSASFCVTMPLRLCVWEKACVCVCVYGRLYSQVAYEFHLSAARGALLRISPNGLVCNCSVNTCLSRQWRAEGKRPLTLWTEATYWAANSYLPPDRKGERRPQLR